MKSTRRFTFWLAAVLAALSLPRLLPAQDNEVKPARFRDLLAVGNALYLHSAADNAYYSVQLLSDQQTAAIQKEIAEAAKLREEITRITQKLTMEQRLEQRATLLLEVDKLESEVRSRAARGVSTTYYEVTHVGDDYVALKSEDRETFVPFKSIRSMYRSGALPVSRTVSRTPSRPAPSSSRFAGGSDFGGRGGFGGGGFRGPGGFSVSRGRDGERLSATLQLNYVEPKALAEVIKKLFAKQSPDVTVDESRRSLSFTADVGTAVAIRRLIERLDVKPE